LLGMLLDVRVLPSAHTRGLQGEVRGDLKWRERYSNNRDQVVLMVKPKITPAVLEDGRLQRIEVYTKMGFILASIFASHKECMSPDKVPGLKVIDLHVVQGAGKMTGILMQRADIPKDVPFFTVKLSCEQYLKWERHILRPEDLLRAKQA